MPVSPNLFSSGSPQHVVFVVKFGRLDSVIALRSADFGFGNRLRMFEERNREPEERYLYT